MKQILLGVAVLAGLATAAGAQQSGKPTIPADMVPPAGMCRIWIKNVSPKQQPAPTDCATAIRTKPANADVVYGNDYAKPQGSTKTTSASPPAGKGGTTGTAKTTPPPPTIPKKPPPPAG